MTLERAAGAKPHIGDLRSHVGGDREVFLVSHVERELPQVVLDALAGERLPLRLVVVPPQILGESRIS